MPATYDYTTEIKAIEQNLAGLLPTWTHSQGTPRSNSTRDSSAGELIVPRSAGAEMAERPLFSTAREIAEYTSVEPSWIVRGLAAKTAITILSAKVKTGKTHFALDLAAAVSAGQPFLGCVTTATQVAYLTEERESSFQNALGRVGLLGSERVHVLPRHRTLHMKWGQIMGRAADHALDVGADLLVIDTLSDWIGLPSGAEYDPGDALEAMRPIQEAAARELAIIVCMHERKSGGETVDAARGSTAFGGAVEIILSLRRATTPGHENRRELSGVGRFDGIPAKLIVEMNDGHYDSLGDAADIDYREARDVCLKSLPSSRDEALTLKHLEDATKGSVSRATLQRALKALQHEGLVLREHGAGGCDSRAYGHWLAPTID